MNTGVPKRSSMVDILSTLSEWLIAYSLSSLNSVNCGVLQFIWRYSEAVEKGCHFFGPPCKSAWLPQAGYVTAAFNDLWSAVEGASNECRIIVTTALHCLEKPNTSFAAQLRWEIYTVTLLKSTVNTSVNPSNFISRFSRCEEIRKIRPRSQITLSSIILLPLPEENCENKVCQNNSAWQFS